MALTQALFSALFPYSQQPKRPEDETPPVFGVPAGNGNDADQPEEIPARYGSQLGIIPKPPNIRRLPSADEEPSSGATDPAIPQEGDTSNQQVSGQVPAIPLEQQARTALGMAPVADTSNPTIKDVKQAARDDKASKLPQFTPPNPNPTTDRERAENELAAAEFQSQHPQDQDHGIKKRALEVLGNFFEGLKYAQPGMGLGESLALGGAGAGAGLLNRGWNERRAAEAAIPGLQRRLQTAQAGEVNQAKIAEQKSQADYRSYQEQAGMAKADVDKLNAQQKPFLDQWKDLDNFDPINNPRDKAFAEQAAKAGVTLTPKQKGDRFQTSITPDGHVVVTNTGTGEYKIGQENVGKPRQFDEKDVSPTEFGLKGSKEIENMANAAVTPSVKDRQIRPDVLASLPPEYKNPDGSFNEQAYLKDANLGISKLSPSDIYQNIPDDAKQRVAKEMTRLQGSQGGLQKQYDRFLSVLNNRNPNPSAPTVSLDDVKKAFKDILSYKGKDAKEKLDEFYKVLQYANIR